MPNRILGNRGTANTPDDPRVAGAGGTPAAAPPAAASRADAMLAATAAPLVPGLGAELDPVAVGPRAPQVAVGELPYERLAVSLHGRAFVAKVRDIAKKHDFKPEWLMAVMFNESGMKTTARNPMTGAVGLIQFMPTTARWLGTSTEALSQQTGLQQLAWVDRYFAQFPKGSLTSGTDLYLANFYPLAVGREGDFKLGSEVSDKRARLVRNQNRPIDVDRDGYISVRDFRDYYRRRFPNLAEG